jgi:hypothetical protein
MEGERRGNGSIEAHNTEGECRRGARRRGRAGGPGRALGAALGCSVGWPGTGGASSSWVRRLQGRLVSSGPPGGALEREGRGGSRWRLGRRPGGGNHCAGRQGSGGRLGHGPNGL